MQKTCIVTKQISRTIHINSSIGSYNRLGPYQWIRDKRIKLAITGKRTQKHASKSGKWKQQAGKLLTGLIGIALNAVALQYTIVSSPIIITPPRGIGTGIKRPAPLSRLFCAHGPSTKSLSLSATSYVLTCRASLLSWRMNWWNWCNIYWIFLG